MAKNVKLPTFFITFTAVLRFGCGIRDDFEELYGSGNSYWILYSNQTTNESCTKYTKLSLQNYNLILNKTFIFNNNTQSRRIEGALLMSYPVIKFDQMKYFLKDGDFSAYVMAILTHLDATKKCAVIQSSLYGSNIPANGYYTPMFPGVVFSQLQGRGLISARYFLPIQGTLRYTWRELWVEDSGIQNFANTSSCMEKFKDGLQGETIELYRETCKGT
uniref:Lipocalin n=1 Tax=Rhipicephalus appendiculatus TaxID=34631 RepID=A0A131Y9C5_RHIAP